MDNETTWDTDETSRWIANDEVLYNIATGIARRSIDIDDLAERMEGELSDIITEIEYCDIDMSLVDWTEIASEYMEDDDDDDKR